MIEHLAHGGRALLVVEDEFLTRHVGVRRVIGHYWDRLARSGYEVDLAAAHDGVLTLAAPATRDLARSTILAAHPGRDQAVWSSADGPFLELPPVDAPVPRSQRLQWRGHTPRPRDYDVSVLTNPWICADDVPPDDYTHAVVYDLVPNLVSAGALDLGEFIDVAAFAHDHHRGFEFYADFAATVSCISDCTRRDLLRFYLRDEPDRAVVDIPFDSRQNDRDVRGGHGRGAQERAHVLLVNPLDHRKNPVGIADALVELADDVPLTVSVVGRERMPWHAATAFFEDLTDAGIEVAWFRGASDDRLEALYAEADVLLFPSLYEGLGLPILEAQAHGLPVVSSSTSSCGEINLNPSLTAPPQDHDALVAALSVVLADGGPGPDVLTGDALRGALDAFLEESGRGLPWGARPE